MVESSVILIATPVYFYTMSAQMKTLIDRTVSKYTALSNKDLYFMATAAESCKNFLERTVDGFRVFLDCLDGAKEKGIIYGFGVWK